MTAGERQPATDVTAGVVALARTLRAAGVDASPERVHTMVRALDLLDPTARADVYWAGRLALCAGPDDIARFNDVFVAYFDRPYSDPPGRLLAEQQVVELAVAERVTGRDIDGGAEGTSVAAASPVEVLRHRDIATLDPVDREELARILGAFTLRGEHRLTRRPRPAPRGPVDRRRTLRRLLRAGGEPVRLAHRRPRERPRRVVLLVDVSGSMKMYADSLLRFAHAASHRSRGPVTEVFTIGTRLTRVTREMSHLDPDSALRAVAATVPDWSGGTRLGERLEQFLDEWGQRGLARGAVVVILSDGWEVVAPALLGEQTARLQRLAHRVVWANPRAGRPGYVPVVAGMSAALPYVDDFVAGNSLAALEQLATVVSGARRA